MISGFHHKVDEICDLLVYNAAYSGNIAEKYGSVTLFLSHKKSDFYCTGFLCTLLSGNNRL